MTAIAIVGMGCRFGGAPDLPSYWRLLLQGAHAFTPVPADRWDADAFRGSSSRDMDRTTAPAGAFLDGVRTFPALALGIPPRRVEVMDPQQRFAFETALEAIEDAGYRSGDLPGRTGVYVGITGHEFRHVHGARGTAIMMSTGQLGQPPEDPSVLAEAIENVIPPRPFSAPGVLGNMCAAIVAQELDLHGPAYTVDAACASGLVAVDSAVAALRTGQIDAALAGGAYIQLTPEHYIAFSRIGAMSSSGHCRPFDARADGFVQGDGVGMVLLKRLADAERDGDRVYAVLHGVSTNNDGRGDGPMAPVLTGQVDVVRRAWSDAGLDPRLATHVETHGTGTSVGDAVEITGLRTVFADAPRVVLGSSKANVGHTMSAAGIAGLIKAALSIHHARIPPLASFESAKEDIGLAEGPLVVPTAPEPWADEDRLAGVSSFGFGGTNGHVVLGAARAPVAPPVQHELILLSAGDEPSLRDLAQRTADTVRQDPAITPAGVARAWARRRPLAARASLVAHDRTSLLAALDALATGGELPRGCYLATPEGAPRIAFLYPGQGAQRVGMLRDLRRRFPIVEAALRATEAELASHLALPLTHLIEPSERGTPVPEAQAVAELTATEHCQPVMFAAGLALTALLAEVGVTPTITAGHSLGELVAATVSGALTPAEGTRFVARRGAAMASLTGEHGAMAAVMAEREVVEGLLVPGAVIANVNHPRQLVISGTVEAVEAVVAAAEAADVRAKRLEVSHAFHSPLLADLDSDALLDGVSPKAPTVPLASATAGRLVSDGDDLRDILRRHATDPVLFTDALTTAADAGADLFLQVGAGGPLASFARGTLRGGHRGVVTLAPLDDADGGFGLLDTLGFLWISGVDVDATVLCGASQPAAAMPPSVLPRESYWVVKDKPTRRMTLGDAKPRPRPAVQAATDDGADDAPSAPEAAAPASADSDPTQGVLAVVSKVSAYPLSALKTTMKLVDDLGFDSLMVGDLATRLAEAFPGVGAVPRELLVGGPTVQDLIDFVEGGGASAQAVDDDAPLTRFAASWAPFPLPELPTTPLAPGGVFVTGNELEHATEVAGLLTAAGIEASAVEPSAVPDSAGTLVWVGPCDEPVPLAHAYNGHVRWPDQAEALLATITRVAAAGGRPDVVALSRADDVWAGGLAGALRALAREWPDARIKHLTGEDAFALAPHVGPELTSADRTVDVRYHGEERRLPRLVAAEASQESPLGSDHTVLVTGGTRGIGLAVGLRLATLGAQVILLGRRTPDDSDGAAISAFPNVRVALADVTDRAAMAAAIGEARVTHLVHAAGLLADGPVESADPERGAAARQVKVTGWLNAVDLCGDSLVAAVGIGSWAGRFGNRHQTHYAAANALLTALADHGRPGVRLTAGAFGPWVGTDMVGSIPAPVQAAMRAEGVDFVGREAGLQALVDDLSSGEGGVVHGRRVPTTTRRLTLTVPLSVDHDPYLADHAIEGTPVLPLAAAADLLAWVADAAPPFALTDLTLFRGVTAREPTELTLAAEGDRLTIRERGALCYAASIEREAATPSVTTVPEGLASPELTREAFYRDVAFHGPMLQGLTAIDGLGDAVVTGRVRTADPAVWTPTGRRAAYRIDPLALDSVEQLAGVGTMAHLGAFGTPVRIDRLTVLTAFEPEVTLGAEAHLDLTDPDRLSATLVLRGTDGTAALVAEGVAAELTRVDAAAAPDDAWTPDASATDISSWPEVADLELRLQGVQALGLQNPYFHVHEGTARNVTTVGGRELVNYSSYNYIGLSGDPDVLARVHEAVDRYGTSVSASRVASGERPFHGELEAKLAACQGCEDALLFTAGHATNVTTVGHLMGPDDLILHDEYIHDSVLQGIKLSGAARRAFRHEDPAHLAEQLTQLRRHYKRCLIIVEGVYSMDGDICQLPAYLDLKERHGCLLMVDEAHSFGIVGATGKGVSEHWGVDGGRVDIWMGTLSKSLASCGGWISGSKALITYLRYTAPGFVYSAGLTPANGVAALASLDKMLAEPERVQRLQSNASLFCDALVGLGLDVGPARGGTGVVPVITGNSMHALVLSQRLQERGINVQPIVYPAVPDDASRLRFFLSSTHTTEQLRWTAETVAETLEGVRADFPLP